MPGFKTFASGDVLTAADVNDYLMEQAVIQCTSATRPSSPNEGMVIYETDTDQMWVYDGSDWRYGPLLGQWYAATPTLNNLTTPKTNVQRYRVLGRSVLVSGAVVIDTASSISGTITIGLPFASENASSMTYVGSAYFLNAATQHYLGFCYVSPNSSTLNLGSGTQSNNGNVGLIDATSPFTWGDGDTIAYSIEYEA